MPVPVGRALHLLSSHSVPTFHRIGPFRADIPPHRTIGKEESGHLTDAPAADEHRTRPGRREVLDDNVLFLFVEEWARSCGATRDLEHRCPWPPNERCTPGGLS